MLPLPLPDGSGPAGADATPGDGRGPSARRVAVLLPYPFPGPFDYVVPEGVVVEPGDVVLVPLHRREVMGVVWERGGEAGPPPRARLRALIAVVDVPPMRATLRRFLARMAEYVLAPPGEVMAMALRAAGPEPVPTATGWVAAAGTVDGRVTAARGRVLAVLADGTARAGAELARAAGVGPGVIRGLAASGLILPAALPPERQFAAPDPAHPGAALSPIQAAHAEALAGKVAAGAFSVTLLDGVTGSGKTEVYLEAIAAALRAGRQALVLLPEIALSSQWLERFHGRFGVAPAVWHSDLSSRTRRITWRAVAAGGAPVVVGARSALFLPFTDLGLVVVDEEHETAFKQEEGVVYHARDMAVVRARLCTAPAELVSATPSLETIANVEAGRYQRISLPTRHGGAVLPQVAA
ncbi:MAG: primosomal protein N', partial [Rhodospirillales bacterium]|nr:primosomal protein N' [Rhodospirillales bacterium]